MTTEQIAVGDGKSNMIVVSRVFKISTKPTVFSVSLKMVLRTLCKNWIQQLSCLNLFVGVETVNKILTSTLLLCSHLAETCMTSLITNENCFVTKSVHIRQCIARIMVETWLFWAWLKQPREVVSTVKSRVNFNYRNLTACRGERDGQFGWFGAKSKRFHFN